MYHNKLRPTRGQSWRVSNLKKLKIKRHNHKFSKYKFFKVKSKLLNNFIDKCKRFKPESIKAPMSNSPKLAIEQFKFIKPIISLKRKFTDINTISVHKRARMETISTNETTQPQSPTCTRDTNLKTQYKSKSKRIKFIEYNTAAIPRLMHYFTDKLKERNLSFRIRKVQGVRRIYTRISTEKRDVKMQRKLLREVNSSNNIQINKPMAKELRDFKELKIITLNTNHLANKVIEITEHLYLDNPDILQLQETHRTEQSPRIN